MLNQTLDFFNRFNTICFKVYLGVPEGKLEKNWYYSHQQLFQNKTYYKNSTTLRTNLWSIKSDKQNVNLSWEIIRQTAAYSNISK